MVVTIETFGQTFNTKVAGVTHANDDGTSRQEIIRRCRPGQTIRLVREPNNQYDRHAIAVETLKGERLGYVPSGDVRLARHIDQGGEVEARILKVIGGAGLLGSLLPAFRKSYGCVIEITKGDFDWKAVEPWMAANRKADELLKDARKQETEDSVRAIALYREAIDVIRALDSEGDQATAWRAVAYPINRLSLTLERIGQYEEAISEIDRYEAYRDGKELPQAEREAIQKRKSRLLKKLKQ